MLLAGVEGVARSLGARRLVLDTAPPLREAAALYLSAGYAPIPRYNDNPHGSGWFGRMLTPLAESEASAGRVRAHTSTHSLFVEWGAWRSRTKSESRQSPAAMPANSETSGRSCCWTTMAR